jgi:DNA polymerase II small subunit
MTEVALRLMRYSRLPSPEAVAILEESPGTMDNLEEALKNGTDLPIFIGPGEIEKFKDGEIQRNRSLDGEKKSERIRETDAPVRKEITVSAKPTDRIKELKPEREIKEISETVSSHLKRPANETRGLGSGSIPLAKQVDSEFRILKDPFDKMGSHGKIDDFRKLFQSRYRKLKSVLLSQYGDLSPCESIATLSGSDDKVRFVGIVNDSRTTKNGHTMIDIEDPSGTIRALISKNKKELNSIRLVSDEIVGIVGKYKSGDGRGGPIVFIDNIFKVDIPGIHRRRTSEQKGLLAAFTSDIHIGSKMYLSKEWSRMIKWLEGEKDASLKASEGNRVKYFIVAGDLVDGIGIYPDQDKDLMHPDITRQYEALAESLSMIPEHIEIILMPGNHDAVRLAEPQPPIPKEYQDLFSNSNIKFLSNPTYFSISGVEVAGYHGKSIDDMVTIFKDVTYEDPIPGMKEMLRSRHFGPSYGMRNQLAPEEEDLLVIEDVPDIFVSGHVHRFGMDNYKGVQLIEGSTWQSQTPFQKMMNLRPQPAKLGVVELDSPNKMHTWQIT